MRKILIAITALMPMLANALTIDEARDMARERYPLIRDYALLSLTEQYNVENAAKAWLPQVSAGLQTTWQSSVASYPEALTRMLEQQGVNVKGLGKLQYKASVEVTQTIWDGGRIKAQQDIARAESRESSAANDVELYQLRGRIEDVYFGILLLEQQIEALKATTTLLKSNLDMMNTLVRNGAAMQCDADAVEAELLTTQQQMLSVESAREAYRKVLSLYIGTDDVEQLVMPARIAVSIDNNFAQRPEMQLFDARIDRLNASRLAIEASLKPTVGAFAQGYFGYPGMNFMEAMMSRKPGFNAMVGVSANWNFGNFYTKKNKLAGISASAQRIQLAKETFEYNNTIIATQQRQEIQRLQNLSQSDNEIVELRKKVRSAAETRLREGVVEPIVLLQRITEEKNAVITANTHNIEYLKAIYSLQTLLAQ